MCLTCAFSAFCGFCGVGFSPGAQGGPRLSPSAHATGTGLRWPLPLNVEVLGSQLDSLLLGQDPAHGVVAVKHHKSKVFCIHPDVDNRAKLGEDLLQFGIGASIGQPANENLTGIGHVVRCHASSLRRSVLDRSSVHSPPLLLLISLRQGSLRQGRLERSMKGREGGREEERKESEGGRRKEREGGREEGRKEREGGRRGKEGARKGSNT